MKKIYERYKALIPSLVYLTIYLVWFMYLEKTVVRPTNIIHMKIDDSIPFCEYFIVPYLLWFLYVSVTVVYLALTNKKDYYRCITFLFTGMTIFLLISTLWPNGHHLRPHVMPRENIFSAMVMHLYGTDTATNLWPSIHVFNSLGAHFAITKNATLRKNKAICFGSLILCVSIIFSTVFLKQHSVFDVLTAFIMAAVLYITVYAFDIVTIAQSHIYTSESNTRRRRFRQV